MHLYESVCICTYLQHLHYCFLLTSLYKIWLSWYTSMISVQASSLARLKAVRSLSCWCGGMASNSACFAANSRWSRLYFIIFVGCWLFRRSMLCSCKLWRLAESFDSGRSSDFIKDMRLVMEALAEAVCKLNLFSIGRLVPRSRGSPGSVTDFRTASTIRVAGSHLGSLFASAFTPSPFGRPAAVVSCFGQHTVSVMMTKFTRGFVCQLHWLGGITTPRQDLRACC